MRNSGVDTSGQSYITTREVDVCSIFLFVGGSILICSIILSLWPGVAESEYRWFIVLYLLLEVIDVWTTIRAFYNLIYLIHDSFIYYWWDYCGWGGGIFCIQVSSSGES